MVRRMSRDLIQVEVEFPESLSKPSLVKVVLWQILFSLILLTKT